MIRFWLMAQWCALCAIGAVAMAGEVEVEVEVKVEVGNTQVLKWQDGRKAVFLLQFDDSCPSHLTNVIPALQKRGMVGTFYLVPGSKWFIEHKDAWEKQAPAAGMEYANHTFSHSGAASVADFDRELQQCNDEIDRCFPDRKRPRLIAFARPGGVAKEKWRVNDRELDESLARHHLIRRPAYYGPPSQVKTLDEARAAIDRAIASGEMGHFDFHGVGGDWLPTPLEMFQGILDKLEVEESRQELWITDLISWHKYQTERQSATVKVLEVEVEVEVGAQPKRIRLQLTSSADARFYDLPLTLSTAVPAAWKRCKVTQGDATSQVLEVRDGVVRYHALPGDAPITLRPAD